MSVENKPLIVRDFLAIERTHLANERTFLAYFRTFIVLLSSGVAILKLEALSEIQEIGWSLIVVAPIFLLVGLWRLRRVNRKIKRYY
jgi:putative membrane protein